MFECSKKMKENIVGILEFYKTEEAHATVKRIIDKYLELGSTEGQRLKALTGEDGRIDLNCIPNIISPSGIAATAWYTDGWYMLPNDNLCLIKKMLSFMGQYRKQDATFQPEEYNAMICQALAEIFGLPSAKYYMAKRDGQEYMLTPDFLREGEELVHIARIEEQITGQKQKTTAIQGSNKKISETLKNLEQYLRNYEYKGKKLEESKIQSILLEYLKQKFFNRFIRNTDEHVFNTAIVINGNEVKMSDMYDYDFTLTRRTTDVVPGCGWQGLENEMVLDNGKSDITSFIEQYKDYPGMQEFIGNFIKRYSVENLEKIVQRNTGIKMDRQEVQEHYRIIEASMRETVNSYNKGYFREMEGEREMRLNLYWKDIEGKIYNIGTLEKKDKYSFTLNSVEYKNALKNGCSGIGNLENEKDELFQFFRERIPGKDSPRLKNILKIFNMENYNEMELLRRSKGTVNTDRFFLEEV